MAKLANIILEIGVAEGHLLRTDVHVFSDSVLCVTGMGMISRADHRHIFSGHAAIQIMREIVTFFMSMFNDIEWWIKDNEHRCLAKAKEVTEYAKQFKLGRWCFCGRGQEKVWYRTCRNKPHGAPGSYCLEHDTEVCRSFTSYILLC